MVSSNRYANRYGDRYSSVTPTVTRPSLACGRVRVPVPSRPETFKNDHFDVHTFRPHGSREAAKK